MPRRGGARTAQALASLTSRAPPFRLRTRCRAAGLHLLVRFDGGSRGNPGPSGCGVVVFNKLTMEILQKVAIWLKEPATNNEAEYYGALFAARTAARLAEQLPVARLTLQGDSQLVIRQIEGSYVVRSPSLAKLHKLVLGVLERAFPGRYDVAHLMREHNADADALANEAMDRRRSTFAQNRRLLQAYGAVGPSAGAHAAAAAPAPAVVLAQAPPAAADAALQAQGERAAASTPPSGAQSHALTLTSIRRLRVSELQEACKQHGLSADGRGDALRERLRLWFERSQCAVVDE